MSTIKSALIAHPNPRKSETPHSRTLHSLIAPLIRIRNLSNPNKHASQGLLSCKLFLIQRVKILLLLPILPTVLLLACGKGLELCLIVYLHPRRSETPSLIQQVKYCLDLSACEEGLELCLSILSPILSFHIMRLSPLRCQLTWRPTRLGPSRRQLPACPQRLMRLGPPRCQLQAFPRRPTQLSPSRWQLPTPKMKTSEQRPCSLLLQHTLEGLRMRLTGLKSALVECNEDLDSTSSLAYCEFPDRDLYGNDSCQ